MCTLTWLPLEQGYVLFFNRDERRTRPPAAAPVRFLKNGMRFLAPLDGSRGGTWLLVNAAGLSVALLNHYTASHEVVSERAHSRGELPLACADCRGIDEAMSRVGELLLHHYAPFHLILADEAAAHRFTWDGTTGHHSVLDPGGALLTTSSFSPQTVEPARHARFRQIVGEMRNATPTRLQLFHEDQSDDPACSVRMSRPDACTHSISRIRVSRHRGTGEFRYRASAEIQPGAKPVRLSLKLDQPQKAE